MVAWDLKGGEIPSGSGLVTLSLLLTSRSKPSHDRTQRRMSAVVFSQNLVEKTPNNARSSSPSRKRLLTMEKKQIQVPQPSHSRSGLVRQLCWNPPPKHYSSQPKPETSLKIPQPCKNRKKYPQFATMRFLPFAFCVFLFFCSAQAQQAYIGQETNDCSVTTNSALGYSCNGVNRTCLSYLTFRAQPPYTTVASISTLLGSSPSQLVAINSVPQTASFDTNQLVLVPVTCSCSGIVATLTVVGTVVYCLWFRRRKAKLEPAGSTSESFEALEKKSMKNKGEEEEPEGFFLERLSIIAHSIQVYTFEEGDLAAIKKMDGDVTKEMIIQQRWKDIDLDSKNSDFCGYSFGTRLFTQFHESSTGSQGYKSRDVLLVGDFRGKIVNLAHARSAKGQDGDFNITKHIFGTKCYMAPEYLENGLVSTKIDVFAFGVLLLEMILGKKLLPCIRRKLMVCLVL
ncbi:unnamed protein product [Linum tenue]|uniref:Protein kinase domain-containing protein n=1 Tax=Linum tenue TaxID=586396 RepID=A0AAV0L4F2_9ROSI|nr:unnamed protein product [Linum tenue]